MAKKGLWVLFAVFATLIGLYPVIYFLVDRKFGLLKSKSAELLANVFWNTGFYTHITFGGIALLIGWIQFSSKIRIKYVKLHRNVGMVYLVAVVLSALAGVYIGFFATGGFIASLGFITLGLIWFYTTVKAYLYIKARQIDQHQKMMVYSYAACFAAVTLRIWLPLLTMIYGDFLKAYVIVAWLCWVPNLCVAYLITRKAVK